MSKSRYSIQGFHFARWFIKKIFFSFLCLGILTRMLHYTITYVSHRNFTYLCQVEQITFSWSRASLSRDTPYMSEPLAFRPQIRTRVRIYAARNPTLSRSCQAGMHNSAACNGKAVNTRIPEYQRNSSFGSEILNGESPSITRARYQ